MELIRLLKEEKLNVEYVPIIDKDNNKIYSKLESFKGRGNRTWERYKKPYQIKFKDKLDLFGMGNAKTYNLITNTFDGTLARNYIFFDLSKKLGLEYSVDAEPVDLYINNNYMGSYLLTEKISNDAISAEILDMIDKTGLITLVSSSNPPIPHSITA